jgi:hypothetical protein
MFCHNCGRYIRGLANKIRHMLARDSKKYGFDCRKLHDVPVPEAKKWLDTVSQVIERKDGTKVTYRELFNASHRKACIKFNNRNHGKKSLGSDKRVKRMENMKMGGSRRRY